MHDRCLGSIDETEGEQVQSCLKVAAQVNNMDRKEYGTSVVRVLNAVIKRFCPIKKNEFRPKLRHRADFWFHTTGRMW